MNFFDLRAKTWKALFSRAMSSDETLDSSRCVVNEKSEPSRRSGNSDSGSMKTMSTKLTSANAMAKAKSVSLVLLWFKFRMAPSTYVIIDISSWALKHLFGDAYPWAGCKSHIKHSLHHDKDMRT